MKNQPFQAIIFDHDGTLVDTEHPDFEACKILFAEYGLPLTLEYWAEKIVGRMDGYDILIAQLIEANHNGVSKDIIWQRLKELWEIALEKVQLMPGVTNLLNELQAANYRLGVATASDQAWVTRWLTHFNLLPYFQVIANSDNIVHNKPAPDVYLFAATQLDVQAENCLVFEDSVVGLQAAKAAGMTVVAVPSHVTKTLDFSQADAVIDDLHQVTPAWLESLAAEKNSKK